MVSRDPYDVAWYDEYLDQITGGNDQLLMRPIEIAEYDPEWPRLYAREEERIRRALGERVMRIEHAGSTSVPTLPAKPIVDVVLEVPDSSDEPSYVPDLEAAGYRVVIREPEWYEHRVFKGPDTNVNVHTFTAGCEEVDTMLLFRDHLRESADDREHPWKYVQQYADAKTAVVQEIMGRAR